MTVQEIVDEQESEAIAQYVAVRTAFGPCWGQVVVSTVAAVRRIPKPNMWPQWMPSTGD